MKPLQEMTDDEVLDAIRDWHDWCDENPGRPFMLGHGWSRRLITIVEKRT